MEAVVKIDAVMTFDTRGGNVRYVLRDSDGNEYTTFRESIGDEARRLEGRRARIEYHESQRGRYTNVYLDRVEEAPEAPDAGRDDTEPDEAAWRTAVEAAPWLVGESEPHEEVPPEELYEKLKPFKTARWRHQGRRARPDLSPRARQGVQPRRGRAESSDVRPLALSLVLLALGAAFAAAEHPRTVR